MARIRSKAEFFRLWKNDQLGNRPRAWEHWSLIKGSTPPVAVGFRELNKAGGGQHEIVPFAKLEERGRAWDARVGRNYMVDEAAPDDRVLLQGEICRTTRGLEGSLAVRSGMRMRQAMAAGLLLPRSGAVVRALLREFVDPSSQEDIDLLLETYPDAAIEFASYDLHVGIIPHRNTLIWEVRDY